MIAPQVLLLLLMVPLAGEFSLGNGHHYQCLLYTQSSEATTLVIPQITPLWS